MGTKETPTQYGGLVACGSGLDYMGIFKLLLDTTDGTGIQTVDLTAYFKTVQGVLIGGNDTLADNAYVYRAVEPGPTVALTSTNLAISVHWGPTVGGSGAAAGGVAATASAAVTNVGALTILVFGQRAI